MQMQISFFKKRVSFFSWLAGRFHTFELTQNGEKSKKLPYMYHRYAISVLHMNI
jgi:hypothetical protein